MIKEIFLPEKFRGKRLYAQRILTLSIQDEKVFAALVHAKPGMNIVEQLIEQPITPGPQDAIKTRATAAVKELMQQCKQYDQVRVAIPSTAVFKELEIPFSDPEKIRMVLDYEVESMLPFSLDEAIIDFIITKKESSSSHVFVAAIRNQDLENELAIYQNAGIEPTSVTLNLLSTYSLFQQIPEYVAMEHGSALIDLGFHNTQISFIHDGTLRLTRSIPRGITTLIKKISEQTKQTEEHVLQSLRDVGVKPTGNNEYDAIVQQEVFNFFNDIQFTLNSFSLKLNYYKGVNKILFTGKVHQINDLTKFTSDLLQIPCELFEPKKIFSHTQIKKKIAKDPEYWNTFATVLGAALPSAEQENFDLRRKNFTLNQSSLIQKQLIAGGALALVMIIGIGLQGLLQIRALSTKAAAIEKRQIGRIISIIPRRQRPKVLRFNPLITKAEKMVKEKEEVWAPFAHQRIRALEVLLELTSIMDKQRFTLDVEEISINQKTPGDPIIEIEGYFKSKEGTGSHFKDFIEFQKRFNESTLLATAEQISGIPAAEKGVQFSIKLKKK